MKSEPVVDGFYVSNLYGMETKQGLVRIELMLDGKSQGYVQIVPDEARHLAGNLMNCAETAIQEEMLMNYLKLARFPLDKAIQLLAHFREYRRTNNGGER